MKSFLIFAIALLFAHTALADYYEHKIVVKFATGSPQLHQWLQNGRKGAIHEFDRILGIHSSQPYISMNILNMFAQKSKKDKTLSSQIIADPLTRIAVIDFERDIDAEIAARKISTFPFVEYAEPLPIDILLEEPNDIKRNGQYYLDTIHVYDAWDLVDTNKRILVGIVDSGLDYEHEDLYESIYINPGEDGIDSLGNSRRDNGIDDDGNGFVDDWRGWDFVSSDSSGHDNDPRPGHRHGTHVGGVVGAMTNNVTGIASVGRYVKLLPVKAGGDNPLGTSISKGYEGILYAAAMGAKVINCSWGSSSSSQAGEEVINKATESGSLIVCAAGNLGSHMTFYPSAFRNVVSVAALNQTKEKADFSNYDESVDVSAPGEDILSTVPHNNYEFMNGTSMASPIVAGVAALAVNKYPDFSPEELQEVLRVSCDDIYHIGNNSQYNGLLGKGLINAYKVVSNKNPRSVRLLDYYVKDENGDGLLDPGEKITIVAKFKNILLPVYDVKAKVWADSFYHIEIENDSLYIGNMAQGDTVEAKQAISFVLPDNISYDYSFKILFRIYDSLGTINTEAATLFANPSYRNMDSNNITTTLNSRGHIGFNDFSANKQGVGFKYKNSQNILFEGALMIGSGYNRVSDCARALRRGEQDRDFLPFNILKLHRDSANASLIATTEFADNSDSSKAGVYILENAFQYNDDDAKDIIFISYDIVNETFYFRDSVFAALFFDWDLGPGGTDNKIVYDYENDFAYVFDTKDSSLPLAGVKVISPVKTNFYGIDNAGNTQDSSFGIYNGFSKREKWKAMSNGILRPQTTVTDVSMVISGGPVKMLPWDTTRVTFAIFAANSLEKLQENAQNSINVADRYGLNERKYPEVPDHNLITKVYPNPASGDAVNIDYIIVETGEPSIEMYDALGKKVGTIMEQQEVFEGRYTKSIKTKYLSSGVYYIVLKTNSNMQTVKLLIEK